MVPLRSALDRGAGGGQGAAGGAGQHPYLDAAPCAAGGAQGPRPARPRRAHDALGTPAGTSETTTKAGLTVDCVFDPRRYAKIIKVSDSEMASLNIQGDEFHPEWNYTISLRCQT